MMGVLQDFGDMMPHMVTIQAVTSYNRFNEPTYGEAQEFKALVVDQVQMVRDQNGEQVVSNSQIYLGGVARDVLKATSKIILPDGSTAPILSISRYPDEKGDYFSLVYL